MNRARLMSDRMAHQWHEELLDLRKFKDNIFQNARIL